MNEKKQTRIMLAAGGSGGHIFPAVSLASELRKAGVGGIFFVSSKRRLDRNLLEGTGYPCFFLSINPMPLSFSPIKGIVFIFKALGDIIRSFFVILRVKPHAVVGFGGYSSGTIALVSKLFGVPLLIHEQNFVPGRANIILSRIADKIAVSFDGTAEYFKHGRDKSVFTGNPLRVEMLTNDRERSAAKLGISGDKKTVLVMGGSQGSSFLNRTLSDVAISIKQKKGDDVQFIHLTGKKDHDKVKDMYRANHIPGGVFSFLERIDDAYASSDLAITRSGAAAVFELAYYAKPMILVPYPNPKNNQRSNAVYFSRFAAALYREERDLTTESLTRDILGLLDSREKMDKMSESARKLAFPEAGKVLAQEVIKLAVAR
jgi:UDP-N-acetylglucosamine--N-acetylmuramyl-(pentapeptide) pyrophosphoryl-undecaprenol N-acetylglucosamine transferase